MSAGSFRTCMAAAAFPVRGEFGYYMGTMASATFRSRASLWRRACAVFFVFVFVFGLHPAHACTQDHPARVDQVAVMPVSEDGQPASPDAVIDLAACHCGCQAAPLPTTGGQQPMAAERAVRFSSAPQLSVSGSDAGLPARPPRT